MSMETDLPLGTRLTDLHNFAAEDAADFLIAAEKGDLIRLETFAIQRRLSVTVRDKVDGTQAIHACCAHGAGRKCLEFLINTFRQQQPDQPLSVILDARDNEGFTPLMTCASHDRVDDMSFLLQQGANPYLKNNYGGTCVHIAAAQSPSIDGIKKILTHCKFDPKLVNAARRDGFTPLILAIYHKNPNVARFLITEANADCSLKTNVGDTALHVACSRGKGMLPIVRLLVEHGHASPNARDDGGSTPLHAAASENLVDVVQYLCEHGAALYFDNHRKSPYDFAKQYGNEEVAEYLREYAARRKKEMMTMMSLPQPQQQQQQQQQQIASINHSNNPSRPVTPVSGHQQEIPLSSASSSITTTTTAAATNASCQNCMHLSKQREEIISKFVQERAQWNEKVEYLKKKLEKSDNDSKREIDRLHEVVDGANNARKFEVARLKEEIEKLKLELASKK